MSINMDCNQDEYANDVTFDSRHSISGQALAENGCAEGTFLFLDFVGAAEPANTPAQP
ncbi:hypothetical protein R6U79_06620 [Pseudomonas putida]|uniref:hypothetical protein n=1 Tax=Pseudomonas putida TaxID=303 RepID=UPI0029DE6AA6|nr:hypothetical protein [Pseudomonas putida]WPK01932.1 hypothetical protein R6U79_06620 [Pseudomonas putida]